MMFGPQQPGMQSNPWMQLTFKKQPNVRPLRRPLLGGLGRRQNLALSPAPSTFLLHLAAAGGDHRKPVCGPRGGWRQGSHSGLCGGWRSAAELAVAAGHGVGRGGSPLGGRLAARHVLARAVAAEGALGGGSGVLEA